MGYSARLSKRRIQDKLLKDGSEKTPTHPGAIDMHIPYPGDIHTKVVDVVSGYHLVESLGACVDSLRIMGGIIGDILFWIPVLWPEAGVGASIDHFFQP